MGMNKGNSGVKNHQQFTNFSFIHMQPPPTISPHQSSMTFKVRDLQHVLDDIRTRCIALEANLGNSSNI